jgi:hypothetical protein
MKSIGAILLTYSIAGSIVSTLIQFPFLGLGITILGFPFALKLSIKELIFIEIIGTFFTFLINANSLIQVIIFNYSIPGVDTSIITSFFIFMFPVVFIVLPIFSAYFMKYLSRFTPKRIKEVLNET